MPKRNTFLGQLSFVLLVVIFAPFEWLSSVNKRIKHSLGFERWF